MAACPGVMSRIGSLATGSSPTTPAAGGAQLDDSIGRRKVLYKEDPKSKQDNTNSKRAAPSE